MTDIKEQNRFLPPMRMHPAYRHGDMTPWGGEQLKTVFGKDIPDESTGEALEMSVIPGLESTDDDGVTLTALIERGFSPVKALEAVLRHLHLYSLVLLTALFSTVFLALPNRRQRFFHVLPGAAAAAGAWVLFSEGYSFYVNHIAKASALYGSLSVLLLMLLWLYACISILFYGALFNCMLFDWKRPEETKPCSDT